MNTRLAPEAADDAVAGADAIVSVDALRALYAAPKERALRKQLATLDRHCIAFIARSPFVVLSTCGADGRLDASPRGGDPGFVRVDGDATLLIPDAPGNNRLDSLQNLLDHPRIGLLFMVPGIDETLRVNGRAVLSVAGEDLARCADARRTPKLVVRVSVDEAYLHCAKAFMRSRLWSPDARVDRSVMPTIGRMIADQIGDGAPVESQEDMVRRYAADL